MRSLSPGLAFIIEMRYNTLTVSISEPAGSRPGRRLNLSQLNFYESTSISKKNLREMQDGQAWGPYSCYLRKSSPQAAPGLII